MRIAFAANPALGHLLPLLPLALAAREAGHEVTVIGGRSLATVVAAHDVRFVEAGPPDLRAVLARVPEAAGLAGARHAVLVWSQGFAVVVAPELARGLIELARTWPPDLVVHDDSEQGTWVAAELLGIPHIALQATAWRGSMRRLSVEPLSALHEALGLPADPGLERWHRYGFLTTRPPALLAPDDPLPPGALPIRPVAIDEAGFAAPGWLRHHGGRPLVSVTLGTVGPGRGEVVAGIVRSLATLDVDVVATVGPDVDTGPLGPLPANAHLEAYIPMSRLLPASSAVVFHGGSGTMLAALAAGVPMLMLPSAADQPENARRCVAAGVARVLEPGARGPEAIREAVVATLGDASMQVAARRLQRDIAAMPLPSAIVPSLEALATAGPDTRPSAGRSQG